MGNKFLRQLINAIQDENTSIAEDAISSAEYTGFIDTGSYLFNAQLSGSLYGGMPNTKCLMLAGEQAVGKTFFALGVLKNFLDKHEDAVGVWYLAEPAVTKKMLEERGIDSARVIMAEPSTVFEWRHHVIKTLDAYMETEETKRPPLMMVLDSLGALSTEKELADSTSGSDKRDMTKQQHIRGTFRIIDKKLAKAKVPMIVTNHTYNVIGAYIPTKEVSGGGGIKYAADLTALLSATKERDEDKKVIGNLIKVNMAKNRIAKQHSVTKLLLSYETGLNRYYGLVDLGIKHGIIEKRAKGLGWPGIEKAVYEKNVYADPTKFFTPEIMELLEAAANSEYEYGKGSLSTDADNDTDIETAPME